MDELTKLYGVFVAAAEIVVGLALLVVGHSAPVRIIGVVILVGGVVVAAIEVRNGGARAAASLLRDLESEPTAEPGAAPRVE
jgi:predicted cobalt transporter CbtA